MMLPGGSPGPNARIPAPWRLIIIVAGTISMGLILFALKQAVDVFEDARSDGKTYDVWMLEQAVHRKD